jgi:hypothetical protein
LRALTKRAIRRISSSIRTSRTNPVGDLDDDGVCGAVGTDRIRQTRADIGSSAYRNAPPEGAA